MQKNFRSEGGDADRCAQRSLETAVGHMWQELSVCSPESEAVSLISG